VEEEIQRLLATWNDPAHLPRLKAFFKNCSIRSIKRSPYKPNPGAHSPAAKRTIRCFKVLATIAMQPLDAYCTRPLKPVLKFKLYVVTHLEIVLVRPVGAYRRPFKTDFIPIFGQNATGTVLSRNPSD
jgi:hypothetical protein